MSDKRPEAKDFQTVGEYAEALVEYLLAQRLQQIEARLANIEKFLEEPIL